MDVTDDLVVALFFPSGVRCTFRGCRPNRVSQRCGGSQSMSVEHAVKRTRCRGGVVLGGNGDDFAVGYTCYAVYGFVKSYHDPLPELVVVDSGEPTDATRLSCKNGCCEIACVGG